MTELAKITAPDELRKRRVMSSFRNLFDAAVIDPKFTAKLLDQHGGCTEPYPGHYAAIYLLGMMRGCLLNGNSQNDMLRGIRSGHEEMLDFAPADFIGNRRKWAKGRGM